MAITYSFTDNVNYGTEDINAIARDLTGAGIAPFPDRDTYSTADLNALTEALVADGVSLGGCFCSRDGNVIKVAPGIIFFDNGVRLRVDEEGYEIIAEQSSKGYVYAYYNTVLQSGGIEIAEELPQNKLTVLLAEICQDGSLKDRRIIARSKVASFGTNALYETEFEVLENPIVIQPSGSDKVVITRKLEGVDLSKVNYAFINFGMNKGLFDINAGRFVVQYTVDDYGVATGFVNCGGTRISYIMDKMAEIIREGNALLVRQTGLFANDAYRDIPMSVTLI